MAADPWVRIVGTVQDIDEATLIVGVDYGTVRVGDCRFTRAVFEELSQLLVSAAWQAAYDDAELRLNGIDEADDNP